MIFHALVAFETLPTNLTLNTAQMSFKILLSSEYFLTTWAQFTFNPVSWFFIVFCYIFTNFVLNFSWKCIQIKWISLLQWWHFDWVCCAQYQNWPNFPIHRTSSFMLNTLKWIPVAKHKMHKMVEWVIWDLTRISILLTICLRLRIVKPLIFCIRILIQ